MAELVPVSANIRLSNYDGNSVCFVSGVSPSVSAGTAAAFVDAIETIYNNGDCSARMNKAYDIER